MKAYRLLRYILSIAITLTVYSCTTDPQSQAISYIADTTEEDFFPLSIESIKGVSVVAKDHTAGEIIRIRPINELGYNPIRKAEVQPVENILLSNQYQRKQAIEKYYNQVEVFLSEIDTSRKERCTSVVYQVIAQELNHLSKSKANKKILVVNSDLMENSHLSNFYHEDTLRLLVEEPDMLGKRFKNSYPLNNLTGISVHLIYQPKTTEESIQFEIVSKFYIQLLQGATVTTSANLFDSM